MADWTPEQIIEKKHSILKRAIQLTDEWEAERERKAESGDVNILLSVCRERLEEVVYLFNDRSVRRQIVDASVTDELLNLKRALDAVISISNKFANNHGENEPD